MKERSASSSMISETSLRRGSTAARMRSMRALVPSSRSSCEARFRRMNKHMSFAAFVGMLCTVSSALGAESLVEVSQPLCRNGAELVIGNMTYLWAEDRESRPELEVLLTVERSLVSTVGGEAGALRNAAWLHRIDLEFPAGRADSSGAHFPGLFGDTLVVVMDLSNALMQKESSDSSAVQEFVCVSPLHEVVEKTVQCLALNARRRWPRIRHLALSIDGSHAYEHWEGVYSLENVGSE